VSSVYRVTGSIHDQILTEGAAEVVSEASAEISVVATNIDSIVEVANNIPGDLAALPDAVAEANASATRAETAAASAVGIDTAAQASALQAQSAAAAAAGSVGEVADLADNAAQSADGAAEQAGDAAQAAALAERWANEAPGVEVTSGKYGAPHYLAIQESLLATAPNLQFRTFGDHAGEEGVDSVTQEFNNAAADFGRGIAINRLTNRPSRLKLLAGLYNGPPAEGADLAMVPVVVSNIGAADCTIEGPTAGSIVLEPSVMITGNDATHNLVTTSPATTRTITLDIPAADDRRFIAVQGITYHSLPGSGAPGLTCSAAGSTVTQRDQAGDGNYAGATPIKLTLWTGTLPAGGPIPGVAFPFAVPEFWASCWQYVLVLQNAAGVEDYDLVTRAGAATSETFTGLAPSIAESMAVVVAVHQGSAAHPITIAPADTLVQGKTPGGRSLKDFSYAVAVQSDRPASALSYTGSSAYASPAVIGGAALTPVTGTVVGGAGALLWKGTLPAVLAPGNMAVVWALSDGVRYQLDMVET
jgi:hypothetical protein